MQFKDYPLCEESMGLYLPTPFFKAYPLQTVYEDERKQERDMEYLKSMYPYAAREIIPLVEDECDKQEYEGSMMFDECPDKLMLRNMRNRIYGQVKHLEGQEDTAKGSVRSMAIPDARRRRPGENWLPDLIDVLLFNEIARRRCRHRRCRRYY